MKDNLTYFRNWAYESDAPPLILTGTNGAITDASQFIQALFPATDIYCLKPKGQLIPISDVRMMRHTAAQSAWHDRRLVIIYEAEKLSAPAAQALLKTLEEPSRSTRLILTTVWYRRLLPTIRSRCAHIRLPSKRGGNLNDEFFNIIPASLLERIAHWSGDVALDEITLESIAGCLNYSLRTHGPTPAIKAAYLRLKEYYLVATFPGANYKLARDVLLSSLPSRFEK